MINENIKGLLSIILVIFVSTLVKAQLVEDAILFSSDQNLGNARNQGMSGATGALGGDLSGASELNPAGIGLSTYPSISATFGLRTNATKSRLEDARNRDSNTFLNFPQIGGTFVFKTSDENQAWKGFSIGINHQKTGYYKRDYFILPPSVDIPNILVLNKDTINTVYDGTQHILRGRAAKTSFLFGSNYKDVLYLGFGVHFHRVIFDNTSILYELYEDDRESEISFENQNEKTGDGVSLSAGVIVKPTEEIRLGLSYQSPTWYSFGEDNFVFFNREEELDNSSSADYDLRTPAKITASAAFNLQDFVSIGIDYQFTQYKNTRYSPSGDFSDINSIFDQDVKNTSSIRIGGELKLEDWFIRAGYKWEESPTAAEKFRDFPYWMSDQNQYSLGVGYKFSSGFQIDAAYTMRNQKRKQLVYDTTPDDSSPSRCGLFRFACICFLDLGLVI